MDIAKSLVRCVARAFYETKHILVVDAIMIHSALRDDDLAHLLGTQTKELHKLCGKLKEDRMVMVHTRLEPKEGQSRPVNRTYYYVDFRATIDAIKYRMYRLVKAVESKMNNDVDSKGYACPRCHKRFTPLDVLPLVNEMSGMFDCDVCGTTLVDDDDSDEIKQSQEQLGRLMGQIEKILQMLRKIDEVVVPANEFSDAIAMAVPVSRERTGISAAVPGLPNANNGGAAPALEINFTSDKEKNAAQLAAEREKKAAQAEQNALPVWHTQSTVSGDLTILGSKEAAAKRARDAHDFRPKVEDEKKDEGQKDEVQQTAIEQYYAALRAKQAQEKAEEDEEEEDDDDDEEGDDEDEDEDDDDAVFEDLPVGTGATNTGPPSGASTSKPSTPVPGTLSVSTSKLSEGSSSMKRSITDADGDSDSSGKSSLNPNKKGANTGVVASPAKRVKIQSPAPKAEDDDDEDSDEEEEFVDV